jgi:hypothetical protein
MSGEVHEIEMPAGITANEFLIEAANLLHYQNRHDWKLELAVNEERYRLAGDDIIGAYVPKGEAKITLYLYRSVCAG